MAEDLVDGQVSKILNLSILSLNIKSLKGVKHLASHLWNGIYKEQTKMMIREGVISEEREADKNSPELPGIRKTNLISFLKLIFRNKQAKIQGKGHRRSGGGVQGFGRHHGSYQQAASV